MQTPNIIVNNLWIENVTRSKAMKETIELNVSFDTSFEDIELLRLEMEKFVRHPDNARDFQQQFAIGIGSINNCDKLTLQITIKHKSNWHNEIVRATRKSKFICALALACKKIPILGPGGGGDALGGPSNPTYSVAVDDSYAKEARDKSAAAADAARMVPKTAKAADTPGGQQKNEQEAVTELTTQPPLAGMEADFGYNRDAVEKRLGSDSPTLSEGDSGDRQRTEHMEDMRKGLLKRESTRGRRKAGEGISSLSLSGSNPGLLVTQPDDDDSRSSIRGLAPGSTASRRQRSFDVESQTGRSGGLSIPYDGGLGLTTSGSSSYGAGAGARSGSGQPVVSPGLAAAASQSYTIYPQSSFSIPGPSSSHSPAAPQVAVPPQAVTTGTTGPVVDEAIDPEGRALSPSSLSSPSLSSPVRGARRRGASISQALEQREQEDLQRTDYQG